ncbi:MAG TPA: ATP-binding cassette domain-containing protein [Symbiobacteriaceae bacterium]|nr:ATP-binding cassette domain-containing protein [Symbiobacteriaceae bacterium]
MLKLSGISHDFGQGPVLDAVSLELAPGRVLALTGPSGCGKSTLLHMVAGLVRPLAGQVENGYRRTAIVFQEPRLLPWRTARENIAFGLKALGVPALNRRRRAEALGERLGLGDALGKYPHQLSGGMRQRVALGRALAVEPDLLLLDEPFGALDAARRTEMQELLLGLLTERNLAALLVTHDLAEAERVGDELLILSDAPGRVLERRPTLRTS